MNKFIYKLGLDTSRNCSKNIWLSFLAVLILISINYRALIMPLWLVVFLSIGIVIFSFASFIAFIYWMILLWKDYSIDIRVQRFLYLFVLGIINLLIFYILLKISSHPG